MRPAVFISLLLLSTALQAQISDDLVEQVASTQSGVDLEQWQQNLEFLSAHKIRINQFSRQELQATGFFDVFLAHNIVQYRERYGAIHGPAELLLIKGFDRELLEKIAAIIDYSELKPFQWKKLFSYPRQEVLWRFQVDEFLKESLSNYAGDALESRLRYKLKTAFGLEFRYNGQKDPGEAYSNSGFDHHAASLFFKGNSSLRFLAIGDYQIHFGQGLSLWSGSAMEAVSFEAPFARFASGPMPFAGNEENRFFRGSTVKVKYKSWQSFAFYSQRNLDARFEDGYFSTSSSGYHRTESEILGKDRLSLQSYGLSLGYERQSWELQVLYHEHHPQAKILQKDLWGENQIPNQHKYRQLSLAGQMIFRGIHLSGEAAVDQELNPAIILVAHRKWRESWTIRQWFRCFHPQYQSWWMGPLGGSATGGSRGFRFQLEKQWSRSLRSLLMTEAHWYPWSRFPYSGPSAERQIQVQQEWKIYPASEYLLRLRFTAKEGYIKAEYWELAEAQNMDFRLRYRWQISPKLRITYSLQANYNFQTKGIGKLILGQCRYDLGNFRLEGGLGRALIPDGNPALYAYEPDVLYGFSIPGYFKESLRTYLKIKWKRGSWQWEGKMAWRQKTEAQGEWTDLKLQVQIAF